MYIHSLHQWASFDCQHWQIFCRNVTLALPASAAPAGTKDCTCCSPCPRTQPCRLRSGEYRSADARFAALTLTLELTPELSTQDKEQVLADVRSIISEQLGTEVDKVCRCTSSQHQIALHRMLTCVRLRRLPPTPSSWTLVLTLLTP